MATIMCLPDEVIAAILGYSDITIEDITNFRCVCEQFYYATKYKKFWEKKFSQRWPVAKKLYDKQSKKNEQKKSKENEQKDKNSLNFIEMGTNFANQLQNSVSQIILKYFESMNKKSRYITLIDNYILFKDVFHLNQHLSNNFNEIIDKPENFIQYAFFTDEIKHLLAQSRRTDCDLTERYCNLKVFNYMRQRWISSNWIKFVELPAREQLLELIATVVAQFIQYQNDVLYSHVNASLDSFALEIQNLLREEYPDHSIFSTSAETFSYWKTNNIDENHWNEVEGTQIMDTLDKYIFDNLKFQPSRSEDINVKYLCIDNVLKNRCGHELILLIIYHSVARRLGLRCDVIQLPYRSPVYCIFWKPKYAANNLENIRCFNISLRNNINLMQQDYVNQLLTFNSTYSDRQSSLDDYIMSAELIWYEINERFMDMMVPYNDIFGINPPACRFCNPKLKFCVKRIAPFFTRSEDVKFAVGMIVTHHDQSNDSCTGVIIGWHRSTDRHVKFSIYNRWKYYTYMEMDFLPLNHCCNFNFKKQRTNYIILTDNNKICYVEEDSITLTTPKWINNSEIGRYFCTFERTHYVPNKMLARLYPQDAAIIAQTTKSGF